MFSRPVTQNVRFNKVTLYMKNNNIKFTIEYNPKELSFLDVLVYFKDGKIMTDIYHKPTDSKQYLDFFSCHPRHIKTNIPFNLARRVCTIVSDPIKREKQLQVLNNDLIRRHYPTKLIQSGINKARNIPISILRQNSTKSQRKDILPIITTFNPNNVDTYNTIKQGSTILKGSKKLSTILSRTRLINCKRQAPNLKKLLTKAKFSSTKSVPIISRCGNLRCKCCEVINTGQFFKTPKISIHTNSNMNCLSKNLIYILSCPCGEFYIGETGDRLMDRTRVHRQHCQPNSTIKLHIHKHINNCPKNLKNTFSIFPFYKLKSSSSKKDRVDKEQFFINRFKPNLNKDTTLVV